MRQGRSEVMTLVNTNMGNRDIEKYLLGLAQPLLKHQEAYMW